MKHANHILQAVSEVTKISIEQLTGRSRKRAVAEARFIAMHEIQKAHADVNAGKIANFLKRDRSSFPYAIRMYLQLVEVDAAFRAKAEAVKAAVEKII